ncbi:MAG TPA: hypothetical protein VFH58_13465 [Acidimicrobiales bacterium]|nr:hypothetical protein [Acidimicrobiales bacterium]
MHLRCPLPARTGRRCTRAAGPLLLLAAAGAALSACGGSALAGSAPVAVTTQTSYPPRITAATFQEKAASYFPNMTPAQRLGVARAVCTSIRTHGNNFMTWLVGVNHDHSLFPYELAPPQVGAFAGLAVSYVCDDPAYLAQLRQGLAGLPSGSSLGTSHG